MPDEIPDSVEEPSPYTLSTYEANRYYAGLSGACFGPKLVYRTTREKESVLPTGPEAYTRNMRLCTVPEDHKLNEDHLWDRIRAEVRFLTPLSTGTTMTSEEVLARGNGAIRQSQR